MKTITRLFSWQDNAFLDLWSIVHILWGGILGFVAIHKKWSFYPSLVIATILIIFWEYIEYVWGINESWTNILSDIVLGITGFITGYKLPTKMKVDPYIFLIPTFLIVVVLEYIGWINYLSR